MESIAQCPWASYSPILSLFSLIHKNLPDEVIRKIKENIYKTPTMVSITCKFSIMVTSITIKNICIMNYSFFLPSETRTSRCFLSLASAKIFYDPTWTGRLCQILEWNKVVWATLPLFILEFEISTWGPIISKEISVLKSCTWNRFLFSSYKVSEPGRNLEITRPNFFFASEEEKPRQEKPVMESRKSWLNLSSICYKLSKLTD